MAITGRNVFIDNLSLDGALIVIPLMMQRYVKSPVVISLVIGLCKETYGIM